MILNDWNVRFSFIPINENKFRYTQHKNTNSVGESGAVSFP